MFGKKSVYRRQFDALEAELKMNLENNYKDLARDALKNMRAFVEGMELNPESFTPKPDPKEIRSFRKIIDTYEQQMKNYHH